MLAINQTMIQLVICQWLVVIVEDNVQLLRGDVFGQHGFMP